MTHNGKIGRLPRNLRDELNHRLENGETAGVVLPWLNALPAVQAVLAAEFQASQINEQNLSNWRKGGYQDWLKQQERRRLVRELTENADELAQNRAAWSLATICRPFWWRNSPLPRAARWRNWPNPPNAACGCRNSSCPWHACAGRITLPGSSPSSVSVGRVSGLQEKEKDEDRRKWAKESGPLVSSIKRSSMVGFYAGR